MPYFFILYFFGMKFLGRKWCVKNRLTDLLEQTIVSLLLLFILEMPYSLLIVKFCYSSLCLHITYLCKYIFYNYVVFCHFLQPASTFGHKSKVLEGGDIKFMNLRILHSFQLVFYGYCSYTSFKSVCVPERYNKIRGNNLFQLSFKLLLLKKIFHSSKICFKWVRF